MIDAPGCYTISAAAYHSDPCPEPSLSASLAHVLLSQSAAHAYFAHPRLNPAHVREDEPKFDVGQAAHALILEGDESFEIIIANDWRTKAAQELRAQAIASGKRPILGRQWQDVCAMKAALVQQLARFDEPPVPFTGGKAEQTLVWREADVWCRARLDWLHDGARVVCDLKTTGGSANPEAWIKSHLFNDGFDLQAAWYLRGVRAVFGVEAAFRFVVVENYAPFAMSVIALSPHALAFAATKVERALDLWRHCLESGQWPAYPAVTCHAELPAWIQGNWNEREYHAAAVAQTGSLEGGRSLSDQLFGEKP